VNELDRAELDQVVQHGLFTALLNCPRPFPRFFFSWLRKALVHRALEHVRGALHENRDALPHDSEIVQVLDSVLLWEARAAECLGRQVFRQIARLQIAASAPRERVGQSRHCDSRHSDSRVPGIP
jgi:DNA-directed RNA polymerase specialized sigma24 family protein